MTFFGQSQTAIKMILVRSTPLQVSVSKQYSIWTSRFSIFLCFLFVWFLSEFFQKKKFLIKTQKSSQWKISPSKPYLWLIRRTSYLALAFCKGVTGVLQLLALAGIQGVTNDVGRFLECDFGVFCGDLRAVFFGVFGICFCFVLPPFTLYALSLLDDLFFVFRGVGQTSRLMEINLLHVNIN